jgi:hypothetical protein
MSNKDTIIEALTMQLKIERDGNLALVKRMEDAVAAEREACAAVADVALLGCERSIRDRVVREIRARGEK